MKQRVTPGGTIDTATVEEIALIVAQALAQQSVKEYMIQRGAINLDGSGNGTGTVKVPSGYDWHVERLTLTGANALVALYENHSFPGVTPSGSDLREVVQVGSAGLYSDGFANVMYIGASSKLVFVVSGGPANGQVTFNLQIATKEHR